MSSVVQFNVNGQPACKGSLKAFVPKGWNRPVLTSTSKGLKEWEALVRHAGRVAGVECVERGPVSVGLVFRLSRPKAMKDTSPLTHDKQQYDVDKLSRAVLDALTGLAYADDGQVDDLKAQKRYAQPQESPGVRVYIRATGQEA